MVQVGGSAIEADPPISFCKSGMKGSENKYKPSLFMQVML